MVLLFLTSKVDCLCDIGAFKSQVCPRIFFSVESQLSETKTYLSKGIAFVLRNWIRLCPQQWLVHFNVYALFYTFKSNVCSGKFAD